MLQSLIDNVRSSKNTLELGANINARTEKLLQPWLAQDRRLLVRIEYFWNNSRDRKAMEKSPLYKLASRTGEQRDWTRHLSLKQEIKEIVKINKW